MKAEERIRDAADPAAAKLVELMQDKKVPHAVQLAAARDLLDRAGIGRGQAIEIKIDKWEQNLGGLVVDLVQEDIEDADVIEDTPPVLPPRPSGATRERRPRSNPEWRAKWKD